MLLFRHLNLPRPTIAQNGVQGLRVCVAAVECWCPPVARPLDTHLTFLFPRYIPTPPYRAGCWWFTF